MIPIALQTYLEVFEQYFEMPQVSEVCINRPNEIWVEQRGQFSRYPEPSLTMSYLWQFARLVAAYNNREITPASPLLSATLSNGIRLQFVVEPACERGSFICSIRKQAVEKTNLSDYLLKNSQNESSQSMELLNAYQAEDHESFLHHAVLLKRNIIISGGTSTGKTTLLNAILELIPTEERIITIETDREVQVKNENAVHLLAAEDAESIANITMIHLLKASLRLRPDRILVSELRGEEAFSYLRAVNSGHPGSITTLHADSPFGVFEQLAWMMLQRGSALSYQEVISYAKSIIDVIVQMKRLPCGKRYIDEIYFKEAA